MPVNRSSDANERAFRVKIAIGTPYYSIKCPQCAMLKQLQRERLDRARHHPSISEGRLQRLRESGVLVNR
jgi:hypothetical protein